MLDNIKDTEIQTVIKDYKFELNDLRTEVKGISTEKGAEQSTTSKSTIEKSEKENIEPYINPSDLTSTAIKSISYYNFDKNNNGKVSNRELKKA
jgi:hypothetical protein